MWDNMDISQRQYAESKKPISKWYKLFDFIFMTICKMQKYRNREQIKGCQGLGKKGGSEYRGQHKRILGVMELFCILITEVGTQIRNKRYTQKS